MNKLGGSMSLDRDTIKFLQHQLSTVAGQDPGSIDGLMGANTERALEAALSAGVGIKCPPPGWSGWSSHRRAVLYIQARADYEGFSPGKLDGYWGPITEEACEDLRAYVKTGKQPESFRDDEGEDTDPKSVGVFPVQKESELIRVYGVPGDSSLQTYTNLPYPMKLAWDLDAKVRRVKCHKLVAGSLVEVLEDIKATYGADAIARLGLDLYGGMLNVRKMRGGSKWSMHAWGIAIDIDPSNNRLRWGKDKARLAKPEYDEWWQIWEQHGWTSLGRERDYDWMHIQAARLR